MEIDKLNSRMVYFEFSSKDPAALGEFYKRLGYKTWPAKGYLQVKLGNHPLIGFAESQISSQTSFYLHVDDVQVAYSTLCELELDPSPVSTENWGTLQHQLLIRMAEP